MTSSGTSGPRTVFGFAALGHFLFHVLAALFLTLVIALQEAWRLPYDELIRLWTPGALLLGLGAPLAGWLSDRWGEAPVMAVFFLGMGLSTVACGLAEGPAALALALASLGLFGAIYHPVGTAWVMRSARRPGRSIAWIGIIGSLGGAGASLVAGLLGAGFGWRVAFVVPGVVTFIAGVVLVVFMVRRPFATGETCSQPNDTPAPLDVRRAFVVLALTMSLTTLCYFAFTTMLPKWLEESVGSGLLGTGALVSAIYLLATPAQLVGGFLSDAGSARRAYILGFGLKLAALVLALQVSGWPILAAALAVMFVFDLTSPIESVLIARFTSLRRRGMAYGIRNGIAILGAPLGVELVSLLHDPAHGFADLLTVLALVAAAMLLISLLLPRDRAAPQSGMQVTGT